MGTRLLALSIGLFLLGTGTSCSRLGRHFAREEKGGSFLVIGVTANPSELDDVVAKTIAVLQKRCDELGIRCKSERLGGEKSNQIKIGYPVVKDPERIKSILLSEGMEFRAVVSPPSPALLQSYPSKETAAAAAGPDKDVFPFLEGKGDQPAEPETFVVVERKPIVTGQDVREATVNNRMGGEHDYLIMFRLTKEAGDRFGTWTASNINNYIGVVFNRKLRSVAYIKSIITDSGEISGKFTKQEAEDAALVLMTGSMPAPIEALEEGIVKP